MVITGVADALPDKITSLVYLDAFVPENGQSLVSLIPPGAPPPAAASKYTFGPLARRYVFGARPEGTAFVDARTTPHPTASFIQAMKPTGGVNRVKKKTYIYANVPAPTTFTPFYEKLKNNKEWTVHTLPCTHIVQMDLPDELTALLLQAIP